MSTGTRGWRAPGPGKSQGTASDTICIFSSVFFQLKSALYFVFIYLFHLFILLLATLGPCCCTPVFSSCKAQASHCSDFPCCLLSMGARHTVFSSYGMWVQPPHVKSSQMRDQTHVPCITRRIPSCWTTRAVLYFILFYFLLCILYFLFFLSHKYIFSWK